MTLFFPTVEPLLLAFYGQNNPMVYGVKKIGMENKYWVVCVLP
ncbi:hypothetical protein [Flavobacterium sp.]|nr:hypothetical protein [Flavobacterium sp.]